MNGTPALGDDSITAMLEARAQRADTGRADVRALVAAAGPRSRRPILPPVFGRRVGLAGAGALVALIAVALVAGPLVGRPGSSPISAPVGSAHGSATAVAPSAVPTPTPRPTPRPLELMTAAEAGKVIEAESETHDGALIAVHGRLELSEPGTCDLTKAPCGATILADADTNIIIRPVGDIGPGPWDGSGPLEGALVLRLNAQKENGVPSAEFVGLLTTPPSGGPAWFVQDIVEGAVADEGAYAAVQGWLVRDPLHPCPSNPRNPPVLYSCPSDDWLSENDDQPLQPNGSSIAPPAAISLSSGSYDRWAPDPAPGGPGGGGVEPRQATYLMWLVSDGCGPNADCLAPPPRWRIVGRFDQVAAPPPSPSPSQSPSQPPVTWTPRTTPLPCDALKPRGCA